MMEMAPYYLTVVILWLTCLLLSLRYRNLGKVSIEQQGQFGKAPSPQVSIIITSHNQENELREYLPLYLSQQYPNEYEVIVVDMNSSDETKDLLENLEELYPHLHHTFCPPTTRDISIQRLALTLGIRSACYKWIVFTHAGCKPSGETWLHYLTQPCTKDVDAVLGLSEAKELEGWTETKWHFFQLWQALLWMPYALRHTPYRSDKNCLCYRKSHFLSHQGFASNSNLAVGAESLLVNHNIAKKRCRINVHPKALVYTKQNTNRIQKQEQTFFMETRQHLRNTCLYRTIYFTQVTLPIIYSLSTIAFMIIERDKPLLACSFAAMWLIYKITETTCINSSAKRCHLNQHFASAPLLTFLIPIWDIKAWIRWRFTRKNTFRKKFV